MKEVLNISKFIVSISDKIILNIGETRILKDYELNDVVLSKLDQLSKMCVIRVYDYVAPVENRQEVTSSVVEGPDDETKHVCSHEHNEEVVEQEEVKENVEEIVEAEVEEEKPVEENKTTRKKTTKK